MNSWNWGTLYFFEQLSGFNIVICPKISLFEPLQNEQFEVRDHVLLYTTYKQLNSAIEKNMAMAQSLINKKTCLYFLDEMSLAAERQVSLSRLKIKTRLFVEQGLGQFSMIKKCFKHFFLELILTELQLLSYNFMKICENNKQFVEFQWKNYWYIYFSP